MLKATRQVVCPARIRCCHCDCYDSLVRMEMMCIRADLTLSRIHSCQTKPILNSLKRKSLCATDYVPFTAFVVGLDKMLLRSFVVSQQ